MDALGKYPGAIRLWDFKGEESIGSGVVEEEGKVWDV